MEQMDTQKQKIQRIRELTHLLNKASKAYYAMDIEIMSNFDYDKFYDELKKLETETGIVLSGSPTVTVGYEAVDELPKERHEKPMLSLDKTKDREELKSWLKLNQALLSWKLDGLTIVMQYQDGNLVKAVTRGNGEIGEVITGNARMFENLPLIIDFKGNLTIRGEAVITYPDFEKINQEIELDEDKYKNPRNLCSGSVRQLNNEITAKRHVRFYAFTLVEASGEEGKFEKRSQQLDFLKHLGFEVVPFQVVSQETILDVLREYEEEAGRFMIPSDGLVLTFDDVAYGLSLGTTSKFPRDSIAFKWEDEVRETTLESIEWSASRTGLINPIAVFAPVELEGTTVSRASVHNISILKGLKLGIGDTITVYKANMIIPQIAENLTQSDTVDIPGACPVCGEGTLIKQINDVQSLYCMNPFCSAKRVKAFSLFTSRDAMNIDGLSEATLEKFIAQGFLQEFADLYHLERFKDEIIALDGFGQKSYDNLIKSIDISRKTTLPRVLYSLGIANIGLVNAKNICREFNYDPEALFHSDLEVLGGIDGVGNVIAEAFCAYFEVEENRLQFKRLLDELELSIPNVEGAQPLLGNIFVITGGLNLYENRNQLKELIEQNGGKVTGSVTSKTSYLINNDNTSATSKNKKAKEVGIPILTEEEFQALLSAGNEE